MAAFDGRTLSLDSSSDSAKPSPLPSRTLIWTAGVAPSPLIEALSLDKKRGRIVVDETLAVPGHEGVWACGDCAAVPGPQGKPYPGTAQHAVRQGMQAGRNIVAALHGQRSKIHPFRYEMIGQFAAIGRHRAVATLFGLRFSGFIAWLMWRGAYLLMLPRLERKLRVFLQWMLEICFARDYGATPDCGERPLAPNRRADGRCKSSGVRGKSGAAVTDCRRYRCRPGRPAVGARTALVASADFPAWRRTRNRCRQERLSMPPG